MKTPKLAQKVLKAEYAAVRSPLALVEHRLTTRLPARSRVRAGLERGLGSLDLFAGRFLGDEQVTRRGAELAGRAAQRERSADLTEQADALRAEADEVAGRGSAAAQARRRQASEQEQQKVSSALTRKQQEQQRAEEQAEQVEAQGKRAAAARADMKAQQARTQRAAGERQVEAKVSRATKSAQSQLKDASEQRSRAAERREDARTMEQLAETEKAKRKSS